MKIARFAAAACCGALFSITLVSAPAGAAFPGANGRIVLAQTGNDFCPDIYSVLPDGSGSTQYTNCPEQVLHPAWSPDGQSIAVALSTEGGNGPAPPKIFVIDATNGSMTQATTGTNGADDPAWSPDGKTIVFAGDQSCCPSTEYHDIYKVNHNLDGTWGTPTKLTTFGTTGFSADPEFSPDGSKILFYGKNSTSNPLIDLFVMNADGTGLSDLTPGGAGSDLYPSWSPNGDFIVFANNDSGRFDIDRILANGTGATDLSNTIDVDETEPAWSPDGTKIVYTIGCIEEDCQGQNGPENGDVWVMNDTGSGQAALVTGAGAQYSPDWGTSTATCTGCGGGGGPGFHQRTVSLTLKGSLVAKGRVATVGEEFGPCLDHVKVKIQRKAGKFKTLKTVTTASNGSYKATIPDEHGTYRALAPEVEVNSHADTCGKAISRTRSH
jgi:TolB protein